MNILSNPVQSCVPATALAAALCLACLFCVGSPATAATSEAADAPRPAGKPYASGVVVGYRSSGIATVGQPFAVTIDFSKVGPNGASATFTADPLLRLAGGSPVTLTPGKNSTVLEVTPSANGLAFINVFTRQGTGASAISIPVQVGPVDAVERKTEPARIGLGGRSVRLVPAQ